MMKCKALRSKTSILINADKPTTVKLQGTCVKKNTSKILANISFRRKMKKISSNLIRHLM